MATFQQHSVFSGSTTLAARGGREGGSQDGEGESASFELVDPPTIRRAQTKIHGEQLPIPKRRSLLHCGRNARLET